MITKYEETESIVEKYRYQISKLASILEENEYLNQEEVADFMSKNL